MDINYGRGWGGARISLSRGSVLLREYFPSSLYINFSNDFCQMSYCLNICLTDLRQICTVSITVAVRDQSEISF